MTLGQTVGDYEIIDVLESSKEGVTYKVRNVLVERLEVLRVLPKALQDDQETVNRFLREAKIHARINHPNIVAFYHATQLDGQLVMTSELVEGTTLERRLELGPLPVAEALGYVLPRGAPRGASSRSFADMGADTRAPTNTSLHSVGARSMLHARPL